MSIDPAAKSIRFHDQVKGLLTVDDAARFKEAGKDGKLTRHLKEA
ncbi:hypothetical protein [Nitrosomonas sp. ANs5]